MTSRVTLHRVMAMAPRVLAVGYALFLGYLRWIDRDPDSYEAALAGLVVAAGLLAIVVGLGKARDTALSASLWVLALGGMHFLDYMVPGAPQPR
jgi:hypothetical protein